jgi:hypothetical protein
MGGRKVDFLTDLRRDRLRKKEKRPFQPTLFARISAIVREHRLTEAFLARLDAAEAPLRADVDRMIRGEREPLVVPLYSLVREEEYRVTRGILERVSNPYLAYSQSPEDILLSGALFARNPALPPGRLSRWDFETLLSCELAKDEVQGIRAQRGTGTGPAGLTLPDAIRERIERLEAFIAGVEGA